MKYYAIPSNNSSATEKHMVEDDILFTNPLVGKGLIVSSVTTASRPLVGLYTSLRQKCPRLYNFYALEVWSQKRHVMQFEIHAKC